MTFYVGREAAGGTRETVAPAATHGPSACGTYTRRATGDIPSLINLRYRWRSRAADPVNLNSFGGTIASFGHVHLHLHVEPLRAPRRNRPLHALP